MNVLDFDHPYPRYGLAVTLFRNGLNEIGHHDPFLLALKELQRGLNYFMLHTQNDPKHETVLKFNFVKEAFVDFKKQNAKTGGYVAPYVVVSDLTAQGTFSKIKEFIEVINNGYNINQTEKLQRSYAPLSGKINKGNASLSEQTVSLLEALYTAIATITDLKPACYIIDKKNSFQSIIPDLSLDKMIDFINLFSLMVAQETENLNIAHLKINAKKQDFKRPLLHDGNYPFAPKDKKFGALGVLAAIGYWARRAENIEWAKKVLMSLVDRPIYMVSYDKTFQTSFSHHIVDIAFEYDLPTLLNSLHFTTLYSDSKQNRDMFKMMTTRFLQQFNHASFKDFFATRAEYQSTFSPILEKYFMSQPNITLEQVQSAQVYGAWLNNAAYWSAVNEIVGSNSTPEERKAKEVDITKQKGKILVQLESTALSARTPQSLIAQLNIITGRASGNEVSHGATLFIQDVLCETIPFQTAKELVMAWMRVRTAKDKAVPNDNTKSSESVDSDNITDTIKDDQEQNQNLDFSQLA